MKRNGCLSILLGLWLSLAGLAAGVQPAESQSSGHQPISSVQMMTWLVAGVPQRSLTGMVEERGLDNSFGDQQLLELRTAGADAKLIGTIQGTHPDLSSQANANAEATFHVLLRVAAEAKAKNFHQAELELRPLVKKDARDAALHFALASMLVQQELWDDAFDEIGLSAQLMPELPENHNQMAYIFYRLDDGPNAVAEARTALSMDPQNAEGYQFLGLGLYANGQYAAAVHAFEESLARNSANADSYYDIGIAQHAGGNSDAAIAAYRQAIHLRYEFWQAHSNLALIFHEQNNLDEAIAEYSEARRLAPEEASVRNNLGNTYCDKGDFAAAQAELRELYRQHPEWQQGHACMARAYLSQKNYERAIEQLHLAILQNPTGSMEHRMLGETLVLDDKLEDGVRELRLAVSLNPDSDVAHQGLGTALFREQELAAAEKEFREALRLNASADNHFSLAACLITMDRYDEALTELNAAARLEPQRNLYRARREELMKLMRQVSSR